MCPHCRKIMGLWNTKRKERRGAVPVWYPGMKLLFPTKRKGRMVNLLAQVVPQHLQERNRYFDEDLHATVYLMQCNHCQQIFHVPQG
jgi:hypothetical protein